MGGMTLDILKTAADDYERAKAEFETARQVRDALIRKAIQEGQRQVDVAKAAGVTRETVRKLTRESADA